MADRLKSTNLMFFIVALMGISVVPAGAQDSNSPQPRCEAVKYHPDCSPTTNPCCLYRENPTRDPDNPLGYPKKIVKTPPEQAPKAGEK